MVAVVSSLGGLQAFRQILEGLPDHFATPIVFLQHRRTEAGAQCFIGTRGPRPVAWARAGGRLVPRMVHVAPPDVHLVVGSDGSFSLVGTERVNFARPAADVLLRSVGLNFGPRAMAVVLTGRGSDGARGAAVVRKQGGVVIAQDPSSCHAWGMPAAAFDAGATDLVLPLDHIAAALVSLVMVKGAVGHLLGRRTLTRTA